MKYSAKQYATALYHAISEAAPKDQDKILENFVAVLKQHGDLGMVDEVEQEFLRLDREAKGIKSVEVKSARELTNDEEKKIMDELNDFLKSKVELRKQVDEGLIGGVVVKVDDLLIDGSIRKNLRDLRENLIK